MRTSLNTTTGSMKSVPGVGGSINMPKQSMNLTSSMSIPMYSTEYEDEVLLFLLTDQGQMLIIMYLVIKHHFPSLTVII